MSPLSLATRRLGAVVSVAAATVALSAVAVTAPAVAAGDASTPWSASALDCGPANALALGLGSSAARVRDDAKGVAEPKLYPDNEAKAYGVLPDKPYLGDGSVTIRTVFHMMGGDAFTDAEKARWNTLIANQMTVLNDSFGGRTAALASKTPFQFELAKTTWTVNPAWYKVTPGKVERDMKAELYEGDSRVLNVYAADIGDGLLGWAYFPKGYNNGRDFIDGVVMLDESMPGGVDPETGKPWKYGLGDTLTHEVGHWLMLDHTFNKGCSAAGDYVDDTPKEAQPQFNCPDAPDTCPARGLDPIHNFMDYTQDSCMNMFTKGQAERMSDAWRAFRASGVGGKG
ncbi:zinc metalloprotease [Oryzobacter telluris]|uniref:zinc metalloprotease n=1 Tax=Oryzobacter telluris TaxID=3149179 RepID=UPI00370D8F82